MTTKTSGATSRVERITESPAAPLVDILRFDGSITQMMARPFEIWLRWHHDLLKAAEPVTMGWWERRRESTGAAQDWTFMPAGGGCRDPCLRTTGGVVLWCRALPGFDPADGVGDYLPRGRRAALIGGQQRLCAPLRLSRRLLPVILDHLAGSAHDLARFVRAIADRALQASTVTDRPHCCDAPALRGNGDIMHLMGRSEAD
jgi:hypothetical protein